MDKDKIQELLEARAIAEQELEKMRSAMTIMFTDIKGSTTYFEKKGDLEGMAMITRHNNLLFPIIQGFGGRVIKTIGDAILAHFSDQVSALKAAAGMQKALAEDRRGRPEIEQIHIRIGLHTGLGLIRDNDVFGDVVNAASRVQHQCEPDQILITDVLVDAAKTAGFECARMGRAELKGKDEVMDLFAVGWSSDATEQLIEAAQAQFEKKLKEARKRQQEIEEELELARESWRSERRALTVEIEQLEETIERARQSARQQVSEDLQSEIRFELEEAVRARHQAEQDLSDAQRKWEQERQQLRTQISGMQASLIEAMERSNNPTRMALAVREQVDARVAKAQEEWNLQWESERKRLTTEIERLKKASGAGDERKDAARRAILEKLGKLPPGSGGGAKTVDSVQKELDAARLTWDTERDQLNLTIRKLELELQRAKEDMRSEVYQELKAQYEPKLAEANNERRRLEQDVQALSMQLADERQKLGARVAQLELALPAAQAAVRKQVSAELQAQFEVQLEEANRLRARTERKFLDATEEWEAEKRRTKKQIAALEEQLKEARDAVFKAQRASRVNTEQQ